MLKRHLLPMLVGAVGFVLAWGAWHLYIDHLNHHAVIGAVMKLQQDAQGLKATDATR